MLFTHLQTHSHIQWYHLLLFLISHSIVVHISNWCLFFWIPCSIHSC
jgi:hypothetical protein